MLADALDGGRIPWRSVFENGNADATLTTAPGERSQAVEEMARHIRQAYQERRPAYAAAA
ncbi:lysR family transcriptional regulator [Bordetella pertussis]|nr:lysR family transcriptional regulator [Bordetella pertussis]